MLNRRLHRPPLHAACVAAPHAARPSAAAAALLATRSPLPLSRPQNRPVHQQHTHGAAPPGGTSSTGRASHRPPIVRRGISLEPSSFRLLGGTLKTLCVSHRPDMDSHDRPHAGEQNGFYMQGDATSENVLALDRTRVNHVVCRILFALAINLPLAPHPRPSKNPEATGLRGLSAKRAPAA